jgi:tRNA (guanine-N7-)-methyltransferase
MRPKDLKSMFTWEDRKPVLQDGLLCVPRYYEKHGDFSQKISEIFGNDKPICVEFCSGNGEWIARASQAYPEFNWVAVEKQFKRTRKIWAKKKNLGLDNLLPVCGLAEDFCSYYMKEDKIHRGFVNFPDPWPKNSHAKNRIIQTPFINMLTSVFKSGGDLTLVTDDMNYSEQMMYVMSLDKRWKNIEDKSLPAEYGSSYFNRLWESMGKGIRYMKFECLGNV